MGLGTSGINFAVVPQAAVSRLSAISTNIYPSTRIFAFPDSGYSYIIKVYTPKGEKPE